MPDVEWSGPDGAPPDWGNQELATLVLLVRGAGDATVPVQSLEEALIIVNRGGDTGCQMPNGPGWRRVLDTAEEDGLPRSNDSAGEVEMIAAQTVMLFVREAPQA